MLLSGNAHQSRLQFSSLELGERTHQRVSEEGNPGPSVDVIGVSQGENLQSRVRVSPSWPRRRWPAFGETGGQKWKAIQTLESPLPKALEDLRLVEFCPSDLLFAQVHAYRGSAEQPGFVSHVYSRRRCEFG
jgi:hypothetical protein